MLRKRSPQFRLWFVLLLGAAAPGVMIVLGKSAEEVFTLQSLLEIIRVCLAGAVTATVALFVERPRSPGARTRGDDRPPRNPFIEEED